MNILLDKQDSLQRFTFKSKPIAGRIVRLTHSFHEALAHQNYPIPVRDLVGQALTVAALLHASLKMSSRITLQLQGNGLVSLLVAQCTETGLIRAMAKWQGDEVTTNNFAALVGNSQLAITFEPEGLRNRYQSIVALNGRDLAHSLTNYFQQSEQIPTFFHLSISDESVAGLFLQLLPTPGIDSHAEETALYWEHITMITSTITDAELLLMPYPIILRRLYHEEELQLFPAEPIVFNCQCSRDKMADALKLIGEKSLNEHLTNEKVVRAKCDFCQTEYFFDVIDVAQLFGPNADLSPPTSLQ